MLIHPASRFRGEPQLPGDKSISHRYAILGAMATGTTRIEGYSDSDDCQATLDCLQALGVGVERHKNSVRIGSGGWKSFRSPNGPLEARNSGTAMRLLTGALAGSPVEAVLMGDESLSQRPMGRILTPLGRMGARIDASEGGRPPLHIHGRELQPIRYQPPVASAQVKSCLLLAGLTVDGETSVVEPTPSRDHTERALPFFAARFRKQEGVSTVWGGQPLQGAQARIPGDFSAAVFFIVAALAIPEAEIRIRNLGINPTRTGLLELLESAGAQMEYSQRQESNGEPVCDLVLRHQPGVLESFPRELKGRWIPNLIDEIPALAVLGTRLKHGLTVRDASELRHKECDRIRAVVENLGRLGVEAEEYDDGFHIPAGQAIQGGEVATFGDHRIAMAFAVGGLMAREPVRIDHPECVAVSFPGFFEQLERLRV
ncbi:MAG: 3-phosphoshikimate 1-carboxyvinyltransferase [Acidobacteriota bacterium]